MSAPVTGSGPDAALAAAAAGEANAQAQFAVLLALSEEAVISLASDETITLWSPTAQKLYGYTAAEAVGQPLGLVFPPDRQSEAAEIAAEVLRGGRDGRGQQVGPRETTGRGKDGHPRDVSVRAAPVVAGDGRNAGALVVVRNLAPQRQTEQAIRQIQTRANQRSMVLETANRVALNILMQRTGQEALGHIAEAARRLTQAREARLGVTRSGENAGQHTIVVRDPMAMDGKLTGEHATTLANPLDAALLDRREPLRTPASAASLSVLQMAIRRDNEVLGGLCLVGKEGGGSFTDADETSLQALVAHAAVAIHHLRLLERQRALVRGLLGAQEEERRAVAYELHDGLTQFVMAAHLHLELGWEAHEAGDQARVVRAMEQSLAYLRNAVVESRRLVSGLRALALEDLGLASALEQLLAEEKGHAGWSDVKFAHNLSGRRYDEVLETTIYRVAQEALTNVRKHAQATCVHLLLLRGVDPDTGAATLTLEVRDWGVGFMPSEKRTEWGHLGLHGMAERVSLLGGTYELRSAPGEGTLVRAVFPYLGPPPSKPNQDNQEHEQ